MMELAHTHAHTDFAYLKHKSQMHQPHHTHTHILTHRSYIPLLDHVMGSSNKRRKKEQGVGFFLFYIATDSCSI